MRGISDRALTVIASLWLTACIVLGGASAAGIIANAALQIGAIAIIAFSLWFVPAPAPAKGGRMLGILLVILVAYLILTAIPLPPAVWSALPGREPIAAGYRILGMPRPWVSIALDRERLLWSALSLLPPVATYVLVRRVGSRGQQVLAIVIVLAAIVSIALGAAQIIGGPDSPLRLYAVTNPGSPVGFFANANHLATLLLAALPFCVVAAVRLVRGMRKRIKFLPGLVLAGLITILSIGLVVDRSIAGIGLLPPAIIATVAVYMTSQSTRLRKIRVVGVALVCLLVATSSFVLLSNDVLRSKFRELPGSRTLATPTTLTAAQDFLPLGSGLGSFAEIYGSYEQPRFLTSIYMNHAHDEYAEVALELGLVGAALLLGFAVWFLWVSYRVWSNPTRADATGLAATVAIVFIAAHSAVDYPLRTSAIASIFALSCAFILGRSDNWMTGLSFPDQESR